MATGKAPHALYRFFADDGSLLYVGITNNPTRRFMQHGGRADCRTPGGLGPVRVPTGQHDVDDAARGARVGRGRRGGGVMAGLTVEQLVTGQRYRVTFDDCCVQGHFVGVFERIRYSEREPDFAEAIVFDTGEVAPVGWGQWEIVEEGAA